MLLSPSIALAHAAVATRRTRNRSHSERGYCSNSDAGSPTLALLGLPSTLAGPMANGVPLITEASSWFATMIRGRCCV